ncbi:hypothetical protein FRC10_012094 [Ceratobasidium sp. 414]|nr:hypothetical protein FRC10_012094 [Ceratobasidium sp. 414]
MYYWCTAYIQVSLWNNHALTENATRPVTIKPQPGWPSIPIPSHQSSFPMSYHPNNKKGKHSLFGQQLLEPPPPPADGSTSASKSAPAATLSTKPKGLTHLKKAILKAASNMPGGLKAIQEEIANITTRIIQQKNPLMERHYTNAKASWELCIETLAEPEIITNIWEASIIQRFTTQYIPFHVCVTDSHKGNHIQAITTAGWCVHIIVCIASYAHDDQTNQKCGGILLYSEGLARKLEDLVWTAIHKYNLNRNVSV